MVEQQQAAILRPETIVEEFKKNRVTHVVTIPDSETNYLYELMLSSPGWTLCPRPAKGKPSLSHSGCRLGARSRWC